jgi:NDP-4-keto-2,6-dideoxyhexose 3-C-methyltransferase
MTESTSARARDCRACGARLDTLLHLGNLHPSAFPRPGAPLPPTVPLDFCACAACRLVQLRHTVDPETMFREYWYRSGINEVMRAELADVVRAAIDRVGQWKATDMVIDVGANDGTLLAEYRKYPATVDVPRIAYEPAVNLQAALAPHAEVRIAEFFPGPIEGRAGRVKILTSIACVYDLDDPGAFVQAVKTLLHPEGVWIVQFQDLDQMLKATAFDNICFEHLCYYSLASFQRLIEPYGLLVVDAEVRAINAGSYRLYIQHGARPATPWTIDGIGRAHLLRKAEAGCEDWQTLETFAWRVGEARRQIQSAIAATAPGTVDLYGASTKANTLLQYCGLDQTVIRQAWERSPEKVGRTTVTGIPIVSEETGRAQPPAALLAGIWQFRDQILQREAAYLDQGGAILFPLPEVDLALRPRAVPA